MRTFIAITLLSSVAFAATINKACKPTCTADCKEVGSGDVRGTNCVMVFGTGPTGQGWYWIDNEGIDHLGTCQESCEETCDNLCKLGGEGGNGQVAEDRSYGYGGYGHGGHGHGYGR